MRDPRAIAAPIRMCRRSAIRLRGGVNRIVAIRAPNRRARCARPAGSRGKPRPEAPQLGSCASPAPTRSDAARDSPPNDRRAASAPVADPAAPCSCDPQTDSRRLSPADVSSLRGNRAPRNQLAPGPTEPSASAPKVEPSCAVQRRSQSQSRLVASLDRGRAADALSTAPQSGLSCGREPARYTQRNGRHRCRQLFERRLRWPRFSSNRARATAPRSS